jgi:hypothetical protein
VRFARIRGGIAIYPKYEDEIDRFCGILAGLGLPANIGHEPDREIQ